jgi:membrane-associated protease RseP (regulator of RpoE activity)
VVVIAIAVLVLGVYTTQQIFRQAYNGFVCDPAGNIVKIYDRGPAEVAGFRVGDVIASVDGVEFRDVRGRMRLPIPKIGDTATLVVDRGGAKHTLKLTHSAPPALDLGLAVSHGLIGLGFLGCGLFAYLRIQTRGTLLLAVVGLCFGLRLMTLYYSPQAESDSVQIVWRSVFEVAGFLGLAVSLHLALAFPQASTFLRNKLAGWTIYLPAVALSLLLVFLNTTLPDATPGLMSVVNTVYGLGWVGYLLAIAVVLVRTYAKASREDRAALGLNAMVLGTVVGVAPMLLVFVVLVLAPSVWLPGSEFASLPAILIPFAWCTAILKAEAKLAILPAGAK